MRWAIGCLVAELVMVASQTLKSRLVGGVIVGFLPYFVESYDVFYFCPPICPPTWGMSDFLTLKPIERY
jgi:hypothetical protein